MYDPAWWCDCFPKLTSEQWLYMRTQRSVYVRLQMKPPFCSNFVHAPSPLCPSSSQQTNILCCHKTSSNPITCNLIKAECHQDATEESMHSLCLSPLSPCSSRLVSCCLNYIMKLFHNNFPFTISTPNPFLRLSSSISVSVITPATSCTHTEQAPDVIT